MQREMMEIDQLDYHTEIHKQIWKPKIFGNRKSFGGKIFLILDVFMDINFIS